MSRKSTLAVLSTLLIALMIGVATLLPAPALPSVAGSDKLHHFVSFTALALPVSVLVPRRIPLTALLLVGYGGLIEMVQPLFGRSRDFDDQIANMAGITAGVVLGLMLHALFLRRAARANAQV